MTINYYLLILLLLIILWFLVNFQEKIHSYPCIIRTVAPNIFLLVVVCCLYLLLFLLYFTPFLFYQVCQQSHYIPPTLFSRKDVMCISFAFYGYS